jgi:hypothetical protein
MLDRVIDAAEDGAVKGAAFGLVGGAFIGLVWRATWPVTPQMLIEVGGVAAGISAIGALMGSLFLFAWNL